MISILLCILSIHNITYGYSLPKVSAAAQRSLEQLDIAVIDDAENRLVSEVVYLEPQEIQQYIVEEWFDENHGWTLARLQVTIRMQVVGETHTTIDLTISLERFGTPSAMLLVPPVWISSPSNGKFESELIQLIAEYLSTQEEK